MIPNVPAGHSSDDTIQSIPSRLPEDSTWQHDELVEMQKKIHGKQKM